MRKLTIAMIGVIVVPVLVGACWAAKFMWSFREHERQVKEVRTRFEHNDPQEWAAIARECQSYWEAARAAKTTRATQPPLPPSLANLRPIYWDVREDTLYLSWTGGFDDAVLALDYNATQGRRTLWLVGTDGGEIAVWSELHPVPETRDTR
jgi:hypothetical protein